MTTLTAPTPPPTTVSGPTTYGTDASIARFTVAQYERMVETGILGKYDKVELLEGWVVLKMARNPPHDCTIQRVQSRLYRVLPAGWDIRTQLAATLPDSQPEPDIAVVRGDYTSYTKRHPGPADIGLLIEIADSSLQRDMEDKPRIYARAGVAAYWVLDVTNREVIAYTDPPAAGEPAVYGTCDRYRPGDTIPFILDGTRHADLPAAELVG